MLSLLASPLFLIVLLLLKPTVDRLLTQSESLTHPSIDIRAHDPFLDQLVTANKNMIYITSQTTCSKLHDIKGTVVSYLALNKLGTWTITVRNVTIVNVHDVGLVSTIGEHDNTSRVHLTPTQCQWMSTKHTCDQVHDILTDQLKRGQHSDGQCFLEIKRSLI